MSISSALNIAISGLRTTQQQVDLTSANIANADTEGYTRKTVTSQNLAIGGYASLGVKNSQVQRTLDTFVLERYQQSLSTAAYADTMADFQSRLDAIYGTPGDVNALDTIYNDFTSSLEALTTTPEDYTTRAMVLANAQALTSQLNDLSMQIQDMRAETEKMLSDGVGQINNLLSSIQTVNADIIRFSAGTNTPVQLLDQRDALVSELSQYIDIRVEEVDNNGITIHTGGGTLLFDGTAANLSFDAAGTVTPYSAWSNDSSRTLGTITLQTDAGYTVDLIEQNAFSSGSLAAWVNLRDDVLPEAQAQLDEFASALSLALSNRTEEGSAVTVGPQTGFDIDLTDLQQGNAITFDYVDIVSGDSQRVTFIRVDDPSMLPLDDAASADPNDTVYGIDFSSGLAAAAADIGAALGASFTVSDQGGNVLRVLDDGGTTATASSLTASVTNTALTDEGTGLPFFVDGGNGPAVYTDSLEGMAQKTGYAGRIVVNPDLLADQSLLVKYDTVNGTPEGEAARPLALVEALESTQYAFAASTGIGSESSPFNGSVSGFLREVINYRGAASTVAEGRQTAENTIKQSLATRYQESSQVDLDQELASLIQLQSAYAANAKVMQAVREMLDALMAM